MELWYETGKMVALNEPSPSKIVCLDVETTGLNPRADEVLQIALIDGGGEILLACYVRPAHHSSWPSAQRIHGISPSMVERCPSLVSLKSNIEKILESADLIVGYNVAFDLSFLQEAGVLFKDIPVFDVMREFAPVAGRWDSDRRKYSWVSLACCAKHYGVPLRAHDALEDAQTTLGCFWAMIGAGSAGCRSSSSGSY